MSVKKRKYSQNYLQYGFTNAIVNDQVVPQCVICFQILSNDSLRPNRLQCHLQTKHSSPQNIPFAFFQSKDDSFKKMEIARKETFCLSPSAGVVEASFEIAHMIAQVKKPHNIGETLIKLCMIKAASLVLGVASSNKLAKISLSDSTIKTGIDELANDIKFQVLQKIQESPFLQSNVMKAEDVFKFVASYFDGKGIQWEKLVGICTDGAPTMLGSQSGFVTKIKQKSPNAVGTHYVIHREALASKTLSASMRINLQLQLDLSILSKQVLPTPNCLPSCAKKWILHMRLCCFISLFAGCQRVICWLVFMT